ncbi:MAG: hypothetical protein ACFFDO_08475 [Candidatus Thorarchaeota archaeon]
MNDKKSKSELTDRIWKIRDYIQELENDKEDIIDYLTSKNNSDDGAYNVWITDVKEFYYNTVSAWEMLRAFSEGKEKNLDNSKGFLYAAKNRLAQSISELKTFKDDIADKLGEKASNDFKKCWDAFSYEFKILTQKKELRTPFKKIVKVSDLEYHLPCSVCGRISVIYKIGYGRFDKKESLVFRGITHERSLNISLAEKLFKILKKEDLSMVHDFMKKYHDYEGLDAYCPNCDKIYCWEHYDAEEVFDDGFYDCTYGTCPNGHKRMIDD